jgi:hypothetical protein
MGLIQGLISNQVFGTDNKPLTVDNSHIFVDNTERDGYFVANHTELRKDVYIQVGEGFQRYSGSEWIDVSAILQGQSGVGIPTFGASRQILAKASDSSFDVQWYDKFPIVEVVDNYNVSLDDYIVLCNFTTEKTITLPTDIENKVFIIKCIGNGNIKFTTQLDGIVDFKLYKGGAITVISKGADYFIIGSAGYGI